MTRVGLVGFGWVNRVVWAPRLAADPRVEFVGVVDPAVVDHPLWCDGLDALLDRRPDLVVVATPNDLHALVVEVCLAAGVAVVVEKPACLCAATFDRLATTSLSTGVPLMVSDAGVRRHDVEAMTREVSVGPRHVDASWIRVDGVPNPGSWFTSRDRAGGGALLDLGWHLADVAMRLLGGAELAEVSAQTAGRATPRHRAGWRATSGPSVACESAAAAEPDVEVAGCLSARFADGSTLALRAAWAGGAGADTTRFEVVDALGVTDLTTTFGFSPRRLPASTLVRRDARGRSVTSYRGVVGAEYDALVLAVLDAVDGDPWWRGRLPAASAVQHLLERAYRAAGVPLPGDRTATRDLAAAVG